MTNKVYISLIAEIPTYRTEVRIGEPEDWIADAERAGAQLREATREAHEALRDLRTERQHIEELRQSLRRYVEESLAAHAREIFNTAFTERLADYQERLTEASLKAIDDVGRVADESFDRFVRQLLERVQQA